MLENSKYTECGIMEFTLNVCANCISDEEEYLICIYDNELKDFDDCCDNWELDRDMMM